MSQPGAGPAPPPGGPRRATLATLIVNPASRLGRRPAAVRRIVETLTRGGYELEVETTSAPGHAADLAREASAAGAEALFALGGDGTLREAAAGLLGSRVPLGFLPGGTANVMALALGLPRRASAAAEALTQATAREFDVGLCAGEPFLMQASCGLDAFVLGRLRSGFKRRFGRAAVGVTAATSALAYRFPEFALTVDGRPLRARFAAVCNIPFYGGAWSLIPAARPDDRRLELLVFRGPGARATIGLARDLFLRGRHLGRSDVELIPVRERVELQADSGTPLQIDGDPLPASGPVEITLAKERLRLFAL